jgi:hypothetical protein
MIGAGTKGLRRLLRPAKASPNEPEEGLQLADGQRFLFRLQFYERLKMKATIIGGRVA